MKKFFYAGLIGLLVFEFLNVYLIMPMPGSQTTNSIDIAYFFYKYRWLIRTILVIFILAGSAAVFRNRRKWLPATALLLIVAIGYLMNFKMSADKMFLQAKKIELKPQQENKLAGNRLVIGIEHNGEAKAYPISLLAYHHQVRDSIGGKPVMVTYCSVCRTGRVFEPIVNGHYENFRLVGMDHFNAMFEDAATKSWWRQSTGEAIAGTLKGNVLPEMVSRQMTVDKWFDLYPQGKIMQPDEAFITSYDSLARFEQGKSKGSLTRTDTVAWKNKSWIVGIQVGNSATAYDWNDLKKKSIIHDTIGQKALVLIVSSDGQSFAAYERPVNKFFTLKHDTLFSDDAAYDFSGRDLANPSNKLRPIQAYQEFWHSWTAFHPNTRQYLADK